MVDFKEVTFWFSAGVIFITFLSGTLFLIGLIHEYSHYLDFKGLVNPETDKICFLEGNSFMNYQYEFKISNLRAINKIEEYTEFKAYFISFLVLVLILLSHFIVLESLDGN